MTTTRGRLRGLTLGVLVALGLLGGAGPADRAALAQSDQQVEDLLWDLQLVPLDGEPSPFTLDGLDGKSYSLAGTKGQVVLLYFWATW
jgi:cytochrome oxidase Cu insertion factor (SCO1/SenC/PrrC family)